MTIENNQMSTETGNQGTPTEAKNQDLSTETGNQGLTEEQETHINQDKVNQRINKLTKDKFEELRKREEVEARVKELEEKLNKKEEKAPIQIPNMPDVFDADYENKVKARDAAFYNKAIQDAEIKHANKVKEEKQKSDQEAVINSMRKQEGKMYATGEKYGISESDLRESEKVISTFIKDPSLARFLLEQEESALVVKYLASSVSDLEELSKMTSMNAAVHINTKILPEALKFKPSQSAAPNPLIIPNGTARPTTDSFLQGVTFE